jgi:hypothetical protein
MGVLSVEEQLLDHESRIKTLENNYHRLENKLTTVENGQLRLENTVLTTSQDQSGLLNTLITNTFDLKKTKMISRKEIIVAILGGGSVLGLVVGAVLKFM